MISAIVPFRNWSLERLEACVAHLRRASPISEIVLVDFGSDEPLGDVPGCRVVRVAANLWCLSEANNIGIAEATNDVVLKIDADVQLMIAEDRLAELARRVASDEVAFYVLQPTDFEYVDGKPARKRLRPTWAEGCANLFSRTDVIEIGGFDTRYFDYGGEDNDLCQRLRRYGKRVEHYLSDEVLHQRHLPSESRLSGRFSDRHKKKLLADRSIFRRCPFRYSDYERTDVFGPAITVAIATTARPNRDDHLAHCLTGLAAQTVQDFEVRICDNGSPRSERLNAAALRKAFPTLHIHLHSVAEPSIPAARNLITDQARGFYIAVHDDDDFSFPGRFEEQLQCIATENGAHGCHSSWIEFDERTGGLKSYVGQRRDIDGLRWRPGKITLHSTGFYRRDVLKRLRYDESLTLGSDHHLHIRMILSGIEVPHTRRYHCLRRLHDSSVSSNGSDIQREVSDITNAAYKTFVGESFLAAVRAGEEEKLWVSGYPTIRQMLSYLPEGFGTFLIELDLETAIAVGFDPVFGAAEDGGPSEFAGIEFSPACRGLGHETRPVMRSTRPMTAGEVLKKLGAFRGQRGVDVVSRIELERPPGFLGLNALKVERGWRRVVSRRYADMTEALVALPESALVFGLGKIEFFAVNDPGEGVHVLLGTYDNPMDLEYALSLANPCGTGDFMAAAHAGESGGFGGA